MRKKRERLYVVASVSALILFGLIIYVIARSNMITTIEKEVPVTESVSAEETEGPEKAAKPADDVSETDNGEEEMETAGNELETDEKELPEPEIAEEKSIEELIDERIASMSLEKRVAQLFFITPEALTGYGQVTAAGNATRTSIEQYPVGGIIYFENNISTPEQVIEMLENTKKYYEEFSYVTPFLSIDEEGGRVARIAKNGSFGVQAFSSMYEIGSTGDTEKAAEVGRTIGTYLNQYGFNMDFAPVADIRTNSENSVIGNRSFGSDTETVANMILAAQEGFSETGIISVVKHFPGHGNTAEDSHSGFAYTYKTLDELRECELVPFQKAIDNGAKVVMVGHISTPNIEKENEDAGLPATLSKYMITTLLREEMGFDGIVITDAMNMGAIRTSYNSGTAAIKAIEAGCDMILFPVDFNQAYRDVLGAVSEGRLTEERINESVRRILMVKMNDEPSKTTNDEGENANATKKDETVDN